MSSETPSYVGTQSDFHRAFAPELRSLMDNLPVNSSTRVLDVPCGNGFYTEMLSELTNNLVALDACEAHVRELRAKVPKARIRMANAYQIQEPTGSFDLIWCAESLISLEPVKAVKEFARLLHMDGLLAILEVDEYHHVLLTWPATLEAALPMALHQASVAKYGSGIKLSPARLLRRDLRDAGFNIAKRKLITFERETPYDEATKSFLKGHFAYLKSFLYPYLSKALQDEFDVETDMANPASLYFKEDTELTVLTAVYYARKRAISHQLRRTAMLSQALLHRIPKN
jgi:SAM-dependent methyltransferase